MRRIIDDEGGIWDVMLGKESWGTLVLLFSPIGGGQVRKSVLQSETSLAASSELDAMDDVQLRARLRESSPW